MAVLYENPNGQSTHLFVLFYLFIYSFIYLFIYFINNKMQAGNIYIMNYVDRKSLIGQCRTKGLLCQAMY